MCLGPTGNGEPLVGFDQLPHGLFASLLEWTQRLGEIDQMLGRFCLEFGIKGCIDTVNRLPVNFGRP